jgi:hypothetical protein
VVKKLVLACLLLRHKKLLKAFALAYQISPVHPKGLKKLISKLAGIN